MKLRFPNRFLAFISAMPLVIALHGNAEAAINKETSGTDLTAGASWVGGAAPGASDVATWTTGSLGGALTTGSALSWQGIDIQAATAAITTTGAGTLTLGTSGINIAAAGQNLSFGNNITAGSNQNWTVGSGRTLTFSNTTAPTLTFGANVNLDGAGSVVFGGGNIALAGAGTLTISNGTLTNNMQTGSSSTRTGATTLSGGSVIISSSQNLFGSGAINLNGGAIGSGTTSGRSYTNAVNIGGSVRIGGTGFSTGLMTFSGATDLGGSTRQIDSGITGGLGTVFSGVISNGGITLNSTGGTGVLTLNNDGNTYAGATTVNSGYLAISNNAIASSASVSLAANTRLFVGVNGTTTINDLSGASTSAIRSDFTITGTSAARTLKVNQSTSGTFAGTFTEGSSRVISLIKSGTAALTLSGAGGYTGGTTLSQGTLVATNANALGGSGTVTINDANTGSSSTTLSLGNVTVARAITIANQGSGTTTLGSNGAVALPTFSGAVTLAKDVTLDGSTNTDRLTFTGGIGGTGNVTVSGTGRVVFATAANTYAGSTTVNAGSALQLSTGAATTTSFIPDTSVVTVNGTLNLAKGANSETIGGLAGSGTVQGHPAVNSIASALVISGGASQTFSGVLSNGGASGSILSLTKAGAGTQTLSGVNTYTGTTTVSEGTLALSGSGSIAGTSTISVASGVIFDVSAVSFTLGTSQTLAGAGTVVGTVNQDAVSGTISATGGNLNISALVFNGDGILNVTPGSAILNVTSPNGITTSADQVVVNIQGGLLVPGQYPVVDYSGAIQGSGVDSFVVGTTPGGAFDYTLVNNPSNSSVDLVVASLADVWSGAFGSEWSTAAIASPKNWTLNASPADYSNGHDVQFTDAATGTTSVGIDVADVTPASVLFNNSALNYTLQGTAAISGGTGIVKNGSGTLTILNTNKFTGEPFINNGTVSVSGIANGGVDSPLGAGTGVTLAGGKLSYTGGNASTDRTLSVTNPSTVEITAGSTTLTLAGAVVGSGGLSKTGAGILAITNSDTGYTGATTINNGVFRLADGGAWGTGAIANNAVLEVSQSGSLTLSNAISGTGTIAKNGAGTLTLTGASTFSGGTTISGGQLNLGNGTNNTASAGTGSIDVSSGATLSLAWNSGVIAFGNNLTGSGIIIRGGTSEIALSGTNSFSGTYQITNNTLAFRGLNSASGQPKVEISSGANLALGNDFAGQTCTISELSGGGGVNPQFDNATGTKTLNVNQSTDTTFSGVMRNATSGVTRHLALAKSGSGTLTLSGANTYTGATSVNAGTLVVTGSLGNSAVTVASTATLAGNGNLGGSLTVQSGGIHSLAVAATPASQTTRTITGLLTLDSGNILTLTAASTPAAGTYILATANGGISGTPSLVNLPSGVSGSVSVVGNNLELTVLPSGDYSSWAASYPGLTDTAKTADPDGDGLTNFQEYAFGLNPTLGSGVSPVTAPDKTAGTFTYTRRKLSLTGLTYAYRSSTNLATWSAFTPVSESSNAGDPVETITVTLPAALITEPKLFLKVEASEP